MASASVASSDDSIIHRLREELGHTQIALTRAHREIQALQARIPQGDGIPPAYQALLHQQNSQWRAALAMTEGRLRAEIDAARAQLADAHARISSLQQQVVALQQHNAGLAAHAKKVEAEGLARADEMAGHNKELQEKMTEVTLRVGDMEREKAGLNLRVVDMEHEKTGLNQRLVDIERENAELRRAQKEQAAETKHTKDQLAQLMTMFSAMTVPVGTNRRPESPVQAVVESTPEESEQAGYGGLEDLAVVTAREKIRLFRAEVLEIIFPADVLDKMGISRPDRLDTKNGDNAHNQQRWKKACEERGWDFTKLSDVIDGINTFLTHGNRVVHSKLARKEITDVGTFVQDALSLGKFPKQPVMRKLLAVAATMQPKKAWIAGDGGDEADW